MCLLWHVVAQPSSHSLRPWTVWLLRSLGAGWPRERVMQVRVPAVRAVREAANRTKRGFRGWETELTRPFRDARRFPSPGW